MTPLPQRDIATPTKQTTSTSPASIFIKALIVTAVILCIAGGYAYINGSSIPFNGYSQNGDEIDSSVEHERNEAFAAIGSLKLKMVTNSEADSAISTMQLDPKSQQALKADIARSTTSIPTAEKADPLTKPLPDAAQSSAIRLAWISVWDTDAEDGDVIKITSQGYARTVILTKKLISFAVPIPANGVINVTGIHDGEGGGITVGLESGASKAIFPIMSVGQTLGLHVTVN